jgi:prepilin-type N-terminal cleavage/methylation domain-containing protein
VEAPGFTLIELIAVAALVLVLTATAIPDTLASVDRSRGLAAARFLAGRMALARTQAVARGTTLALVFDRTARGIAFRVHRDGNRNGVLAKEVRSGVDAPIDDRVRLYELFPGVAIGVTPSSPSLDPIRLGGSDILSFTPSGTASSGTIYISGRDGTQWAVRILGATARTRVLRYIPERDVWAEP